MNKSKSESKLISFLQQIESIEAQLTKLQESNSIYYCYGTTASLNALSSSLTTAQKELKNLIKNEGLA